MNRWVGFRLFAILAIGIGVAVMWDHRSWFDQAAITAMLQDHPWAPLAFIAVHIVVSLVFIPRTVMALVAGALWGLWWGSLWTVIGSMAGSVAGFALARALGGQSFQFSRLPKLGPIMARMERGGWLAVLSVRLLPLPHTPVNYAFGLTNISWSAYLFGSLLGVLPSAILFVAIGATGSQALGGGSVNWIVPLGVVAACLMILMIIRRK